MSRTISRAALLRGRWRREKAALRPPWAAAGDSFDDLCDGCGDCITACPPGIVLGGPGGRPEVDFGRGACNLCGACAAACPSGALADRGEAPWPHVAEIGSSCLSIQGIACRLCEEHCETHAIRFHPALGGRSLPAIAAEACTACGACAHVCPTQAVSFQEVPPPKIAAREAAAQEISACPTA